MAVADTREDITELVCESKFLSLEQDVCHCFIEKCIDLLSDEQIGLLQILIESDKNQRHMNEHDIAIENEFVFKHYGEMMEKIAKTIKSKKEENLRDCGITGSFINPYH